LSKHFRYFFYTHTHTHTHIHIYIYIYMEEIKLLAKKSQVINTYTEMLFREICFGIMYESHKSENGIWKTNIGKFSN